MNIRIYLVLTGLFLAVPCYAEISDVALADHALRLAIQKYNPDHHAPMIQGSVQHRTMLTFLKETLARFPELAKLPFYTAENRYLHLILKVAQAAEIQKLKHLAEELSQGCPQEVRTTTVQSTLSVHAQKSTEITTKSILGAPLSPTGARCRHPLIAFAYGLGLQELEFRQYSEGKTQLATLTFNSAFAQDMAYVQNALLAQAPKDAKPLLSAFEPEPLSRQNDYYESLIVLHPTTVEENIEVEFIDRWERDGALYTRHYFVRATPVTDAKRSFKIELLREFGPEKPK